MIFICLSIRRSVNTPFWKWCWIVPIAGGSQVSLHAWLGAGDGIWDSMMSCMIESSIYIRIRRGDEHQHCTAARMMWDSQLQIMYRHPWSSNFKIKQKLYPTDSCGLERMQRKAISMMDQQSNWLMRGMLKVAQSGFAITRVSSQPPGAVQNAGLGQQISPHGLGPGHLKEPLFPLEWAPVFEVRFWDAVPFLPVSEVKWMMTFDNPFPLKRMISGIPRKVDLN